MLLWLILAVSLIAISYWAVALVRRWITQKGILDIPNARSSHQQATPRGGGVVIVVVTLGAWFVYLLLNGSQHIIRDMLPWGGALMVAVTGWWDDVKSLSSKLRLGIHIIVAILGMIGSGVWRQIPFPLLGDLPLGWLGYVLTLLWIVGLVNAYNFMDGIDGIAGSQAVIAGGGWFILGVLWDYQHLALLGIVLATTSLGFLFHNWHPASIFMGDVASGFLGYMFAILPLMIQEHNAPTTTLFPGVLLVWPFLFDTILTFLRRLKNGEDVLTAHRSHLYQRLVISGLNHQSVTLLYALLASLGLLFTYLVQGQIIAYIWAICTLSLCGILLFFFVYRRESRMENTNCK